MLSLLGEIERVSKGGRDVLVRNWRLLSAFTVVSSGVLMGLGIEEVVGWVCDRVMTRQSSDPPLPQRRRRRNLAPFSRRAGIYLLCPLSIFIANTLLSYQTSQTRPTTTEGFEEIFDALPLLLTLLTKTSIFLTTWFLAPVSFMTATNIASSILTGADREPLRTAFRNAIAILTRRRLSTTIWPLHNAALAALVHVIAFLLLQEWNEKSREPRLGFGWTVAQVVVGWVILDVGIVVGCGIGRAGFLIWRGCLVEEEEEEEEKVGISLKEEEMVKERCGGEYVSSLVDVT